MLNYETNSEDWHKRFVKDDSATGIAPLSHQYFISLIAHKILCASRARARLRLCSKTHKVGFAALRPSIPVPTTKTNHTNASRLCGVFVSATGIEPVT